MGIELWGKEMWVCTLDTAHFPFHFHLHVLLGEVVWIPFLSFSERAPLNLALRNASAPRPVLQRKLSYLFFAFHLRYSSSKYRKNVDIFDIS